MRNPLPTDQLINQLKEREISFNTSELEDAISFFTSNSYYRFSGYTYIFESYVKDETRSHKYPSGLTFSEIKNIYLFDKKLRLLILEALEELEVAIKTIICDDLSLTIGSDFLSKESYFKEKKYNEVVNICNKAISSNKHTPYINKDAFFNLESWKLFEIMTLGQVIKIYKLLKNPPFKALINKFQLEFIIPHRVGVRPYVQQSKKNVYSVLKSLQILRNHCAHHNRLIDYNFNSLPPAIGNNSNNSHKVARHIHIMNIMLKNIRPDNNWKDRIDTLITEYGKKLNTYYKVGNRDNYQYKRNNTEDGTNFIRRIIGELSDEYFPH